MMKVIQAELQKSDARFGIVVGEFNSFIVESLLQGAISTLTKYGVSENEITIVKVPGAFEIPLAAKKLAQQRIDAVIALGAVIRGSTPHFDYVAGEAAKGIAQVALNQEKPIVFGVLTTDTIEQAIERAGTKAGNKGAEAALTALEMISVLKQISNME